MNNVPISGMITPMAAANAGAGKLFGYAKVAAVEFDGDHAWFKLRTVDTEIPRVYSATTGSSQVLMEAQIAHAAGTDVVFAAYPAVDTTTDDPNARVELVIVEMEQAAPELTEHAQVATGGDDRTVR